MKEKEARKSLRKMGFRPPTKIKRITKEKDAKWIFEMFGWEYKDE